jgi:hypothetical protein
MSVIDAGPPQEPWTNIACAGYPATPLAAVSFTRDVSFVGIYRSYPGSISDADAGSATPATAALWASSGDPCSGAANYNACRATFDLLIAPSAACMNIANCGTFLVTTSGDDVTRSEQRSSLVNLLGMIDTGEKAAVLVGFDGHDIACNASSIAAVTQTRPSADGFEVRTEYDRCGQGRYRDTISVTFDGYVSGVTSQRIGNTSCQITL